jgi:hypothetical protein
MVSQKNSAISFDGFCCTLSFHKKKKDSADVYQIFKPIQKINLQNFTPCYF